MLMRMLFAGLLIALLGRVAPAAEEPVPGSVEWVEAQIEAAKNFEIPEGIRVRWRREMLRLMTDAELAETRQRIAGKPDHPDRFAVMGEEQRSANGPDVAIRELLYGGPDRWRINETNLGPSERFADMALNQGAAWQLTPTQAQLIDPVAPRRGYDPASRESMFTAEVNRFLLGPFFAVSPRQDYEVLSAVFTPDDGWRCRWRQVDGKYEWLVEGIIEAGVLLTAESRIFSVKGGRETLQGISVFTDLRTDEQLGMPVFQSVVHHLSSGEQGRIFQLLSIHPLSRDALRDALRPPKLGGSDSIRGVLATTQIVDYRGDVPEVLDRLEDGTIQRGFLYSTEGESRQTTERWWRIIGWVSGFLVVLSGVLLWWQRRKSL